MTADRFKVFGERNTGTNALKQVIERNSDSRCLPSVETDLNPLAWKLWARSYVARRFRNRRFDAIFAGCAPQETWKHCATNFRDASDFRNTLVLFTVRHPGSWLLSLFRNPYQRLGPVPDSFSEFLDHRWETVGRELLGGVSFRPLELYQAKVRSYLEFKSVLAEAQVHSHFVRFEDLVMDQENVFSGLRPELSNPAPVFAELTDSTKSRKKDLAYYRRYYGQELWREELTDIAPAINAQVDWGLFDQFGYSPL